MNSLYIALPLFMVFVSVIAWLVVQHDKKVCDRKKEYENEMDWVE